MQSKVLEELMKFLMMRQGQNMGGQQGTQPLPNSEEDLGTFDPVPAPLDGMEEAGELQAGAPTGDPGGGTVGDEGPSAEELEKLLSSMG